MHFTNFTSLMLKLNSIPKLLNNLALLVIIIENKKLANSNAKGKKTIEKLLKSKKLAKTKVIITLFNLSKYLKLTDFISNGLAEKRFFLKTQYKV